MFKEKFVTLLFLVGVLFPHSAGAGAVTEPVVAQPPSSYELTLNIHSPNPIEISQAQTPDYDKDVLIPLRAAQAKAIADKAQAERLAAVAAQAEADRQAQMDRQNAIVAAQQQQVAIIAHTQQIEANGYNWGQCTWYVAGRRGVPSNWGNANQWAYNARLAGWTVSNKPVVGSIAQTSAGYFGHVALVEAVGNGTVTVSEMNVMGVDVVDTQTYPVGQFVYLY